MVILISLQQTIDTFRTNVLVQQHDVNNPKQIDPKLCIFHKNFVILRLDSQPAI